MVVPLLYAIFFRAMRTDSMKKWLALLAFWGVCSPNTLLADWFWGNASIMGTNIEVQVWADNKAQGDAAIKSVFTQMEAVNQLMSPYIETSQLAMLNREAAQYPVKVDTALFELIEKANTFSAMSHGAFDITFASVGFMYDYRNHAKPDQDRINKQLNAVNYRHISLDNEENTVFFNHPDVKIDLGGIGKGYAVDKSIEALIAMGIEHALVTAGGDTRLLGDRRGRPWVVGIRDPRNEDKQAVRLPLESIAISTSGDYERYFEEDGNRYHHILSPKTGKSVYEVQSVSIIGPSSTINDALSTTVFVLGVVDGINLINTFSDYEAIILDNERKLHYSAGLTQ
ncbi:FAD:protein FMN transferase [Alteromonas sp. KC3]|uniref:FAD:protein FMN transferase n=1 Tax=unclassified Alteromonas TaxID=2614992 RepID=UPI00193620FC|nr:MULTISPECIES: FAD:protein FMN transferase [unclassified Alteromonas]BCO20854.1 FAD:protein FMN transferase [Alteromonas sp. KC3]BCO24824.1 FAD:protein FMN transferase [Alteromonas sp. KC14]